MLTKKWLLRWSSMSIIPIFCIGKPNKKGYVDIVQINQYKEMHTQAILAPSPYITFCHIDDLYANEDDARQVRDNYLNNLNIDLSHYEIK